MKKIMILLFISFIFFFSYEYLSANQSNNITIVIDPRYGGENEGPISKKDSLKSKDMTLMLSNKITSLLASKWPEYKVLQLRRRDITLTEKERIALVNSVKDGILLSIGVNMSGDPKKMGISFLNSDIIFEGEATIKSNTGEIDPNKSKIIGEIFDELRSDVKENYNEGIMLSKKICNNLKRTNFVKTCSANIEPDALLIHSNLPSTLIMIGYLSNNEDLKKLQTNEYYDMLASSICEGIDQYFQEK